VLWPAAGQDIYQVTRQEQIPEPVAQVVRHLWQVSWRRPAGASFASSVLTNPLPHLTFEDAEGGRLHGHAVPAALLHGLVSSVFAVQLPPAGRVTGVAFHPGALTALAGVAMAELTDRVVPAVDVFGGRVLDLADAVPPEGEESVRRALTLDYLGAVLEPRLEQVTQDPAYAVVRAAEAVMRARDQVSLESVAREVNVSPRTLQRIFARYVGASPLWVLRRYRLQDAAAALDAGAGQDLAGLAAELGFADQAHFTRAFTAVIGVPPSRYRAGQRP